MEVLILQSCLQAKEAIQSALESLAASLHVTPATGLSFASCCMLCPTCSAGFTGCLAVSIATAVSITAIVITAAIVMSWWCWRSRKHCHLSAAAVSCVPSVEPSPDSLQPGTLKERPARRTKPSRQRSGRASKAKDAKLAEHRPRRDGGGGAGAGTGAGGGAAVLPPQSDSLKHYFQQAAAGEDHAPLTLDMIPKLPLDGSALVEAAPLFLAVIKTLYRDEFFVECCELYRDFEAALQTHQAAFPTLEPIIEQLHGQEYALECALKSEILPLLAVFDTTDGWKETSRSSDGTVAYYRKEEGSSTHAFRVAGNVPSCLFNVVSCLYEMDLMHEWLPGLSHSAKKTCTKFSAFGQQVFGAPWPFANREASVWGYGGVIGDRVIVYFRDAAAQDLDKCTEPDSPSELWQVPNNHVRVQFKYGGFLMEPISPTVTHVSAIFNFDPMLPSVPYWFLNFVSEKFCVLLIRFMRNAVKKVNDPTSEYTKRRLGKNKHVYDEMARRMVMYLGHERAVALGLPVSPANP